MYEWSGQTRHAGRVYVTVPLLLKPRRIKVKGHEYLQHNIYLPRPVVATLYEAAGRNPEEPLPVIALLAPAAWFHILKWRGEPIHAWQQLPRDVRLELEALGLTPEPTDAETLTVLASRKELQELGLDPSKPVTLEDLRKSLEKKAKPAVAPA